MVRRSAGQLVDPVTDAIPRRRAPGHAREPDAHQVQNQRAQARTDRGPMAIPDRGRPADRHYEASEACHHRAVRAIRVGDRLKA